jgi:hypothetical protein
MAFLRGCLLIRLIIPWKKLLHEGVEKFTIECTSQGFQQPLLIKMLFSNKMSLDILFLNQKIIFQKHRINQDKKTDEYDIDEPEE